MNTTREDLGNLVKLTREYANISQDALAQKLKPQVNRSHIAHLEQGIRIPKPDILAAICNELKIPLPYWKPFTCEESLLRFEFEEKLSELAGTPVGIYHVDEPGQAAVETLIHDLFKVNLTLDQAYALLNSILVFYGLKPMQKAFFERYFSPESFGSPGAFETSIQAYQAEVIRLFSTFADAYRTLNNCESIGTFLYQLKENPLDPYHVRTEWNVIEIVSDDRLPDLGYISAARVAKEATERQVLKDFLIKLAEDIKREGLACFDKIDQRLKRRMDTLLRQFQSKFPHGLFSPLFAPDPDELIRESERLAPKTQNQLERMRQTQEIALRNFSHYLSADHMDVYVATSMRSDADYVSVNYFVKELFNHEKIRKLKLRYFNPTQSWVDDRIAKGLVEALMLRRANFTIYMAQKSDTFGKDSEASVALGQGKPVIIYVPKINIDGVIDTEAVFKLERPQLLKMALEENVIDKEEVDDTVDEIALFGRLLSSKLEGLDDQVINALVAEVWADFDLYGETDRLKDDEEKAKYRRWLDQAIKNQHPLSLPEFRTEIIKILVATAINFEKRAHMFREIHPLALQVILSSGVLNGIIVVRSINECAEILSALIRNKLDLEIIKDENNYRLVEKTTGSTIRVISRHQLLQNAFEAYYSKYT